MRRINTLFLVGLTFVFNVVNMSGFGAAYETEKYTFLILAALSFFLLTTRHQATPLATQNDLYWVVFLTFSFLFSSLLGGTVKDAFICLSCFLITYIFSNLRVDGQTFIRLGWMMLAGSYAFLLIFVKGDVLSGWNPNAIAMLSFFCYVCYMATVMFTASAGRKIFAVLATVGFIYLMNQTDSRTSTICTALSLVILLFPRRSARLVRSRSVRTVIIRLAIILAAFAAIYAMMPGYAEMDAWSIETFGKPLFNGREEAWKYGFEMLKQHPLLGVGSLKVNNWHNWSMSLITSFGIAGYLLWTGFVRRLIDKGQAYMDDPYVLGCTAAFLLILIQQSTELGLIGNKNVHLVPYMLLGLLLGRVRYLKELER